MIQLSNPHTGIVTAEFEEISFEAAKRQLQACQEAQSLWKSMPVSKRCAIIGKVGEKLRTDTFSHAQVITEAMGKPITEAKAEVLKCADLCDYYAARAEVYLEPKEISTDYLRTVQKHEALGTILCIMPWNFPYWQVFRAIIPAILVGNGIALKHASIAMSCGFRIQALLEGADLPMGLLQNLVVQGAAVLPLISEPEIAGVTFTGSNSAGEAIAREAGKNCKKTVMELGGSDPAIVLEDADLVQAVDKCVAGRMLNAGQSCISVKRVLVQESVYVEFLERACAKINELVCGDPMDPTTQIGPLASRSIYNDLSKQVQKSVRMGARVIVGGRTSRGTTCHFPPTLIDQITPDMPIWEEETFGPVMCLMPFTSIEQAIEMANDTQWGLGASIYSSDTHNALKILESIQAGTCTVNDFVKSDPRVPFGGVKKSGWGRELGLEGLHEFTNLKIYNISK
jgi:succinate-semialdehyde dehydrogenase/glutarate-semialdehyde dehydrogenase